MRGYAASLESVIGVPAARAGRAALILIALIAGLVGAELLASTGAVPLPAPAPAPSAAPLRALESLPLAAQGPVSAALGRSDPGFWVHGMRAANPAQGLRIRFTRTAVSVAGGSGSIAFALRGATATVAANRVTYDYHGGVREWFANGPLGLEQGFTVPRAQPGAGGRLTLSMALAGDLRPRLEGGQVLFGDSLRYAGLVAADARGRTLPASISLHGHRLVLSVDARGARYPIRVDPFVQAANLNEAGTPSDAFGYSSAVSGATIAVGAPAHAVGSNTSQGAVFVFTEPKTGWANSTTSTMLTASDGAASSELGYTVATNGSTIVSGAPGNGTSGIVYVFAQHANGTWGPTQTTELAAPGSPRVGSYLAVAISPDGHTIAFGAEDATVNGHAQQGEAFAATEPSGGWGAASPQFATLTASDGAASDTFGLELAAADSTIVVAGSTSGSGSTAQALYVFTQTGGAWASGTQTAELQDTAAPIEEAGSGSLAISPDGKTIVAGDSYAMVGANGGQGDALVFAEPGAAWANATAPSATLTSSDGASGDDFGFATGASNDTVVVSAPGHAVGGVPSIAGIYVYDEPATGWSGNLTQSQELNPNTTTAGEAGYSLGFDGATIVAGTRGHQQGAWVFTNPNASTGGGGGGATAPPGRSSPPGVSGTGKAGSTLTCTSGTWTNDPTTFTYQWYVGGTPIPGATSSTYVVQPIDEGLTLTCSVTATNSKGSTTVVSGAGVAVRVPKVAGCPAASGRLAGIKLGLVKLGMTRAQARRAFTHSSNRGRKYEDFFCLTPIGIRVGYASPKLLGTLPSSERSRYRGRVVWASTSSLYYTVHGIRRGATIKAARKRLKLKGPFHVGLNDWYVAPNGTSVAVFKVRRKLIEEVGIGVKALLGSSSADSTFLRSFS